jgi:hypothetical protein
VPVGTSARPLTAGITTETATDPSYQEGTAPGEYRYTPGTPFAFAPSWEKTSLRSR